MSPLSLNTFANDPFANLPPIFPLLNIPDDYCPLTRRLSFGDFDTFRLPDGSKAYCLKQSAGVTLWWTLSSIANDINTAGISPIRYDHAYPAAVRSYIPDFLFQQIGMPRPEVLKVIEIDSFNPLYHLTTIPNIVSFWNQLQQVGLAGLAWIQEAKARCNRMGPACGWDWHFHQTQLADVPTNLYHNQPIIDANNALGLHLTYRPDDRDILSPTPPNSEASPTISHLDLIQPPIPLEQHPVAPTDMVLHPIYSHYAQAYPNYDVFSRTRLVDNGYIDVVMGDETTESEAGSTCSDTSSSFSDCHSCHSLPISSNEASQDLYHMQFPIMFEDIVMEDVSESGDEERQSTASDLAANMFPVLRSDIVNA